MQNIFDNEVLAGFVFYGGILAAKMLIMGPLTGTQRFYRRVFSNPEDASTFRGKVVFNNEIVERIRRAHQNDIENIYLYIVIATFYLFTHPSKFMALACFKIFTATRLLHTIVYLLQIPQPARALAYMLGLAVQAYMVMSIILYFM